MMLSIPVFDKETIRYLSFPIGYRMWTKEQTKLATAADLVKEVMEVIGSKRLFICTKAPDRLLFAFDSDKLGRTSAFAKANVRFLPLTIYSMRWHIEVAYYEQKKFWSFGAYMLRSKVGIERLTNLLTVLYAFMTLLPFYDSTFFSLSHKSPQQSRFVIGMTIWHELFWRLSISTAYLQIIYLLLFLSVYKPFIFPKTWKLVQNIRQSLSF